MTACADPSTEPNRSTNAVERITVRTPLEFRQLVRGFEKQLGRWEPKVGDELVAKRAGWPEVKQAVALMAGRHGLMIIYRADQGKIATLSGHPIACQLYLVGNPDIATGILRSDIRAGMFVPFRVQLYEEDGKGVISYDRPGSSLATLGNPELKQVGADLDDKMASVVTALLKMP